MFEMPHRSRHKPNLSSCNGH